IAKAIETTPVVETAEAVNDDGVPFIQLSSDHNNNDSSSANNKEQTPLSFKEDQINVEEQEEEANKAEAPAAAAI
ncbi:hypothetical protein, partial [Serratia marcescens]|uniref:hypothetical protein n=1 Tax=Serratia marcescens TaxID=615 RepID=UPI0028143075